MMLLLGEKQIMSSSDLFRRGRIFDYDRLVGDIYENVEDIGAHSIWPSKERPPDPMAYRIRYLMETYLKESHQKVLEDTYFIEKSIAEQARERGCTRQAVQNMLNRAKANLVKAIAEHGDEVRNVPSEEY